MDSTFVCTCMHSTKGIPTGKYSIIIPAYNEEKCIKPLITNIQKIDSTTNKNVEIVFLNDGSIL